jgi:hypothetical protein
MCCSFASRIQIRTIHIVPNILKHANWVSVVTMDIYLIIIIKDCKALATKNCMRRLISAKLGRKKAQNMRKKHQQNFLSKWLADFCALTLRPHTIDHKASSIYFNCVPTPLPLINRQYYKKSRPWQSWTSNCVCKYRMFKNKQDK